MVLLLWWPLRQRPGLGTVSNVVVLGLAVDATCALVPPGRTRAVRVLLLAGGVLLNGVATGLYIAAGYGPGPRDGLTTGLHRRTGRSLRLIRTAIELGVLAAGFALGGSVGAGTVLYALAIGPLAQYFLRIFALRGLNSVAAQRNTAKPPTAEAAGHPECPAKRDVTERVAADTI